MNKKKSFIYFIASLFLLGLISSSAIYYLLFSPIANVEKATFIYITPEDNTESIYRKLSEEGIISQLSGIKMLASYDNYEHKIKTGCYAINPGDNTLQLFRRISRGSQSPVKIIIPTVRTIDKLCQNLGKQLMVDSVDFAIPLKDSLYCTKLGFTPANISALFIPNTYEVYWNTSVESFLNRMLKEYNRFWNEKRLKEAEAIGFTPIEVVTIASIVEEETTNEAEKPIIAGLYINRLHKGMLLQACPTVKFALQDFELKRILNVHLKTDSPYNTYLYSGLTPGPIRIPSIKSIDSVLHYEHHNYLFMCAKEDFSGTHRFTSSMAEHLHNARLYQQALNRRKVK